MPLLPGPATTRRTALAASGLGLLAAGCGTDGGPGDDDPDPDEGIVDEAVLLVATALVSARDAGRRHPSLALRLRPFVALHRAHLAALPDATAPAVPAGGGGEPRIAFARLRELERDTSMRLAELAVAAESGLLARLLASMSAGVSARLSADLMTSTGPGR